MGRNGRTFLRGAELLDPEASQPAPGSLLLRGERIEARLGPDEEPPSDAQVVDLAGRAVAPGFLDLHFHGSVVFAEPAGFAEALARDAASLVRHGTTSFLATTVAWAASELAERVERLAELVAGGADFSNGPAARPIGLHLEGPWINAAAAGAQPGAAIRPFDPAEGEEVLARAAGLVRMVTFAPEVGGADALLRQLEEREIVAALGHSLGIAPDVEESVARGARHVTHLFNAMGAVHHREPGLAGLALADDRLTCDLICDGAHVHPDMVRVAARAKREQLVLITDRVDPPDLADASFGSGPVRDDGVALRLEDGRLAGSRVTLDVALRNAIAFADLGILEAIRACTSKPAQVLGLESEIGTLRPGARADLVVLDDGQGVVETWIGGSLASA